MSSSLKVLICLSSPPGARQLPPRIAAPPEAPAATSPATPCPRGRRRPHGTWRRGWATRAGRSPLGQGFPPAAAESDCQKNLKMGDCHVGIRGAGKHSNLPTLHMLHHYWMSSLTLYCNTINNQTGTHTAEVCQQLSCFHICPRHFLALQAGNGEMETRSMAWKGIGGWVSQASRVAHASWKLEESPYFSKDPNNYW